MWVDESQCKWLGKDEQKVGVTERERGGGEATNGLRRVRRCGRYSVPVVVVQCRCSDHSMQIRKKIKSWRAGELKRGRRGRTDRGRRNEKREEDENTGSQHVEREDRTRNSY